MAKQTKQPKDDRAEPAKERPVRVVRIRNVRGNVWANKTQDGSLIYNVTIDRLWKDDDELGQGGEVLKAGEWHQSPSFGKDDLLLVGKIADLCHTWVYQRLQDRNQTF